MNYPNCGKIITLKKEAKKSTPVSGDTDDDNDVLKLPLYQQLNVMLSQAQGEAAALETRIRRFEKNIAKQKELLRVSSEVEAELMALNRDYEITRNIYQDLVMRREASKLSSQAEQTGDKLQFKIIEPPRVPHKPVSPDRIKLSTLVLLLALGGGIGMAILYEQLRPTFYNRGQLAEFTDLPVLGSVSMYWTAQEKLKRRMGMAVFAAVLMALFVAYGGVIAHYYFDIGLDQFV